jgi:hypothetical protein
LKSGAAASSSALWTNTAAALSVAENWIADVDKPVLVRGQRLHKTAALARGLEALAQQPCLAQHPVHTGRADGHDAPVQHHETKPAIAFHGIVPMKLDNGLHFPSFQPKVARHRRVVLTSPQSCKP